MDQIERPWSPEEDEMLINLVQKHGFNWSLISKSILGRSASSCCSRWHSLPMPFKPEEDKMLLNLVEKHGRNWSLISKSIPGKPAWSCESRWLSLQRSFTPEEDEMLQNLVEKHGPNWPLISNFIPGRSAKSCELRWDTFQNSMTNEDITIGAYTPIPTFSDFYHGQGNSYSHGQGSSYIHDSNLSHEIGGVSEQAPSIGDMVWDNMSSGSTHAYSRDGTAPSWNALNIRDSSTTMTESDNLLDISWEEFEQIRIN